MKTRTNLSLGIAACLIVMSIIMTRDILRTEPIDQNSSKNHKPHTRGSYTSDNSETYRSDRSTMSSRRIQKAAMTQEEKDRQEQVMFDALHDLAEQPPLTTEDADLLSEVSDPIGE